MIVHMMEKALEMVDEFLPDLIILDVMLPYREGLEVSPTRDTNFPSDFI